MPQNTSLKMIEKHFSQMAKQQQATEEFYPRLR